MACLDPRLRVLEASPEFLRLFGRTAAEVRERSALTLLGPYLTLGLDRWLARPVDGRREPFAETVHVAGANGGGASGDLTAVAVGDDAGLPLAVLLLFTPHPAVAAQGGEVLITDVEARILEGVAAGSSTVRIASRLFMSRQGVEYHVGAMLRRLEVPNRAALVAKAYSLGILAPRTWPSRVASELVR